MSWELIALKELEAGGAERGACQGGCAKKKLQELTTQCEMGEIPICERGEVLLTQKQVLSRPCVLQPRGNDPS